ncbi:MAG: hypothetical protein J6Z30_06695 [Pyramidobacter sp.]|nr:hypothetical protein [Pyramidobacter sp.]
MATGYNITFVDRSDEVKKTLVGLSKTALRASGKVIRKYLRENIPVRSKRFKNHIGSWVMINRETGQPTLQIGFYGWQRVRQRGKQPSHASPFWIEFGTKPHEIPKEGRHFMRYNDDVFGFHVFHPGQGATNVLRDTVADHIAEIRAAQAEYLAELTKTIDEAKLRAEGWDEIEEDD